MHLDGFGHTAIVPTICQPATSFRRVAIELITPLGRHTPPGHDQNPALGGRVRGRSTRQGVVHTLTVPLGAWTVIRVDGRGFTQFTQQHFDKPCDARFSGLMVETARAMLTEFDARYADTESDEISIVLDPSYDLFGRSVEKIVSVSAGIASAAFTHAAGQPAHFDSRVWIGASATT